MRLGRKFGFEFTAGAQKGLPALLDKFRDELAVPEPRFADALIDHDMLSKGNRCRTVSSVSVIFGETVGTMTSLGSEKADKRRMMDLRVWVTEHGAPQVVHNVTDQTTCREVIHALAQATSRTGRFVLTLRQGCSERSLAPGEKPAQFIHHITQGGSNSADGNVKLILYHLGDDTVTRRGSSVHSVGLDSAEASAESVSVPSAKGNFAGSTPFLRGMYEKGEPSSNAEGESTPSGSLTWLHGGSLSAYSSSSYEWRKLSNSSLAPQTVRHPPPSYEETMQSRCKHVGNVGSLKTSSSSSLAKPAAGMSSSSQADSGSRQSWPPVSTAAELARFICGQNTVLSEQQDIMQSLDREIVRWLQRKEVQRGGSDLECQIAEHENQLKNVLGNIESLKKMNLERQIAAIRRNLEKTSCEIRANTTECQKLDRRLAERNQEIKRLRAEIEAEKLYISSRLNASGDSCDFNVSDLEDQVEAAEETRKAKLAVCQQLRRQLTNANMESLEECLDGLKLLQSQPARRHDSTETANSGSAEAASNAQELPVNKNASVWV
uniref:Ras-associating domain-containing protein n=2 Tax=Trichuris muris TaxID=70415 RepID=A0A5S6Q4M5_TRIMR